MVILTKTGIRGVVRHFLRHSSPSGTAGTLISGSSLPTSLMGNITLVLEYRPTRDRDYRGQSLVATSVPISVWSVVCIMHYQCRKKKQWSSDTGRLNGVQ